MLNNAGTIELGTRALRVLALNESEAGKLVTQINGRPETEDFGRIIVQNEAAFAGKLELVPSESLQAVVSQRLVQKVEGGRIAAMEVMLMTSTIRDCVRDQDRMDQISDLIEEGREHYGSQTFDQHLMELVKSKAVDFEVAKAAANNPADFDLKMNMFGPTASSGGGPAGTAGLADEMSSMMGG